MEDSGIDSSDKDMKPKYLADDSENSSNDTDEVVFQSNPTTSTNCDSDKRFEAKERINSCRALQKKLELKVERAKKNYRQLQQTDGVDAADDWDVCITQPKSTNLIPINRLQYPGRPEQHSLIEYKEVAGGENAVEDDLGGDEAKFFAYKNKKVIKQDLSDTFSIQEMTIESDSDESGSDTLELLMPTDAQYWERLAAMLPCCSTSNGT